MKDLFIFQKFFPYMLCGIQICIIAWPLLNSVLGILHVYNTGMFSSLLDFAIGILFFIQLPIGYKNESNVYKCITKSYINLRLLFNIIII